MDIPAIFASLRRSSMGPVLIILQVALTLAILLNSAGIVREHVQRMHSDSGVDEPNVFSFTNRWIGSVSDAPARVDRDLAVMRAVPGVVAAVSTNGVPLGNRGWGVRISSQPVDPQRQGDLTRSQLYYLDQQGLDALGLRMVEGRWFSAEDVTSAGQQNSSGVAVLTRALADHLFPDGKALGKAVYTAYNPNTVIGIVESLQISDPGTPSIPIENTHYSVMLPMRMAQVVSNAYIVRTRPGSQGIAMRAVEQQLRAADPMRVITHLQSFAETRHNTYRANRALTAILVAVSGLLVLVTSLGIAGLTSYWVAQRQRMIGVRRALGARRIDILAYFHSENLLIVGTGVLVGTALAISLNSLVVKAGVPRLDNAWLAGGVIAVLCIGQFAALIPALRATRVPPAQATRSG